MESSLSTNAPQAIPRTKIEPLDDIVLPSTSTQATVPERVEVHPVEEWVKRLPNAYINDHDTPTINESSSNTHYKMRNMKSRDQKGFYVEADLKFTRPGNRKRKSEWSSYQYDPNWSPGQKLWNGKRAGLKSNGKTCKCSHCHVQFRYNYQLLRHLNLYHVHLTIKNDKRKTKRSVSRKSKEGEEIGNSLRISTSAHQLLASTQVGSYYTENKDGADRDCDNAQENDIGETIQEGNDEKDRDDPIMFLSDDVDVDDVDDDDTECSNVPREPMCSLYNREGEGSFWNPILNDPCKRSMIPPVSDFNMAPLSNQWRNMAKIGMAIELRNPLLKNADNKRKVENTVWLGTTEDIRGYLSLINMHDFNRGQNSNQHKLWISLLDPDVLPLHSHDRLQLRLDSQPFMKSEAMQRVTVDQFSEFYSRSTVPDIKSIVAESMDQVHNTWKLNENCEVLDIQFPHQNRLAYINGIVGNRIHVKYYTSASSHIKFNNEAHKDYDYDEGFWCNYNSENVHKLGWSRIVGMKLKEGYFKFKEDPSVSASIPQCPPNIDIEEGMYLEVRHPKLTYRIVGAVIIRVLNHGYFMVQTMEHELPLKPTRTRCVFHITSPFVLEPGFCEEYDLNVDFDVLDAKTYLARDQLPPYPIHNFRGGHRLEAVKTHRSEIIHPATVVTTAAHLLRLHFDGTNKNYENYIWVDAHSSEIYPVGYSQSFGVQFQGYVTDFQEHPVVPVPDFPGTSQQMCPLPLGFPLREYF